MAQVLAERTLAQAKTPVKVIHIRQGTLGEYAPRWLAAHHANHRIGDRALERYSSVLRNHIHPRWGALSLKKVTHSAVRAWFTSLEADGMSFHTLAYTRAVFSAMMASAVEDGLIQANPVGGIRLPRKPKSTRTPPTPGDLTRLLDALPEPYRLLAKLEYHTGLRTGEALALTPEDVVGTDITVSKTLVELSSPQRFEVKGYTKNGDHRVVRVSAEFADELREKLPIVNRNGNPPARATLSRQWARSCKAAGIPCSRRHDLRHAHATVLANTPGVPLPMVQHRLGHRSILTTQLYVHADIDAQNAAVAAMERLSA